MDKYSLSIYASLFSRGGKYLLHNSRNNGFYNLNESLYNFLNRSEISTNLDNEVIQTLINDKVLVKPGEDDDFFNQAKGRFLMYSMNTSHLGLTIAPTIQCNLRCPYCFEENKPKGIMTDETADKVLTFIKDHKCALTYSICWFGGEPLLAPNIIRRILDGLSEMEEPKMTSHSIVTNATLINDSVIELFKDYPLGDIQITLDGNKSHHDKKRFYASGKGTFNHIFENFNRAVEAWPNTAFVFRINIDKSNFNDYFEVSDFIRERYPDKRNIRIYPGILRANKGCESEVFFSSKDHVEFDRLLRKHSPDKCKYPYMCAKGCTATNASSYVIGPNGEIYLCWEHIGNESKIIGNIENKKIENTSMFYRFLNQGHMFDDAECRKCGLMPLCTGGCPNKRIENTFGDGHYNLCAIYKEQNKEVLYDILFEYYLSKNEPQSCAN